MTREQKLEEALRFVHDDSGFRDLRTHTLVAVLSALAAPPDTDTRVVTVDQLELWITVIEATESCLKTWNGSGSFMDVDGALSQIRAIIEGKDQ